MRGVKKYTHPISQITYYYHRKTGVRLLSEPGTTAFKDELDRAEATLQPEPSPQKGTLGHLMTAYRGSHYFRENKPRTRNDYNGVLNYLSVIGKTPLSAIDGPFVVRLRDKVYADRKRRFANYCLSVLSVVLEYGIELGVVKVNAVKGIKRIRRRTDAPKVNRPWTRAERDTVMNIAPPQLLLPIAIARWTGMRQGDILKMPPTAFDGYSIRLITSKASVQIGIPVAGPLKAVIDAAIAAAGEPTPITLCANSRGKPWTESGFRASFFKMIGALEVAGKVGEGLTFHGLRHSVATELREAGFDSRTIADMLGQKTASMADHYSSEADLSSKLKGVVRKMEKRNSARTKTSTNHG
ncbi:tyrosine-type recombinase/integrase [Kaistia terrae]|uniref:Tyrosine-type recombinase/integrase n=1 Tax=Kaistia terrae TaxID=537017 RepID=A0ABW0PYK4_9HYPH|nr:site-specific integrase [Kaistia terrae]MCX5580256.1 site-specific integrase [Kaistia terrae]